MLCRTSHRTHVDESWNTLAVALRNASKCVGGTLNMPCDLINYHVVNVNEIKWQCTILIWIWLFYLFVLLTWSKEVISVRFVVSSFDTLIFLLHCFVECSLLNIPSKYPLHSMLFHPIFLKFLQKFSAWMMNIRAKFRTISLKTVAFIKDLQGSPFFWSLGMK